MMRKTILSLVVALCGFMGFLSTAGAQTSSSSGSSVTSIIGSIGSALGASSGTVGSPVAPTPGQTGAGISGGAQKVDALFSAVISGATTLSASVTPEANKFAYGLGVITIVLAAVRFAGTHHAITAWTVLFEEVGMLGIFAGLFTGFNTVGPGIYNYFVTLQTDIIGTTTPSALQQIASISGSFYDSFIAIIHTVSWYDVPGAIFDSLPLLLAFVVTLITSVVFDFFINMGELQAAIGIVVGPIAFALGFSSYTRGYFKTWLDYMISSGMYCVVAAIMQKLVTSSVLAQLAQVQTNGTSTTETAGYALDLSLFIFLMSFEIPKIAGSIFGGGASASGGSGASAASKAAKAAAALA